METLERSRVCRLCGKHAALTVKIFDKHENHSKRINSVLPIVVHEMDLLPKHMCNSCHFKLQDFHNFYENCLKTDANLKSQLSWMQGSYNREEIIPPMVQINSGVQIKSEPPDCDEEVSTQVILNNNDLTNLFDRNDCMKRPPERVFQATGNECSRCGCFCGKRCRDDGNNSLQTRANRRKCIKKCNDDLSPGDEIKRNLFAKEIIRDEKSTIRTQIPVCHISRAMLRGTNKINRVTIQEKLENLEPRRNSGAARKSETAPDTVQFCGRILRSRNNRVAQSNPISSSSKVERSTGRMRKNLVKVEMNASPALKVKLEVSDYRPRSLRPRIETVDYADTKRKNPMAHGGDVRRKPKISEPRSNMKDVPDKSTKTTVIRAPIAVKAEPTGMILRDQKNRNATKVSLQSRKIKVETSEIAIFPNEAIGNAVSSAEPFGGSKFRDDCSKKELIALLSKRRKVEANICQTTRYLRSQRVQLRSGKLKNFEEISKMKNYDATPKENQRRNTSSETKFKGRICGTCKALFPTSELYILHNCYSSRH